MRMPLHEMNRFMRNSLNWGKLDLDGSLVKKPAPTPPHRTAMEHLKLGALANVIPDSNGNYWQQLMYARDTGNPIPNAENFMARLPSTDGAYLNYNDLQKRHESGELSTDQLSQILRAKDTANKQTSIDQYNKQLQMLWALAGMPTPGGWRA